MNQEHIIKYREVQWVKDSNVKDLATKLDAFTNCVRMGDYKKAEDIRSELHDILDMLLDASKISIILERNIYLGNDDILKL